MNIGIDANGDWDMSAGELVFVNGAEEIRQFLIQKLRTVFQEWFLDARLGLPYFEQIFQKRPDPVVVESIFINEIVSTPGLVSLVEFDLNLNEVTRTLELDMRATTVDGEINFSEVLF